MPIARRCRCRYRSCAGSSSFEEFFRALAFNAMVTLHINRRAGRNAHHVAEACFKATARALRMASEIDPRAADAIPSTKGAL